MAETMKGSQFTRKVGPLPVWAWAALIIVAYLAYRHFKGSSPATAPTGSSTSNPVPGFDAASGGINGAYTPGTGSVYNYYYGDQNAAQAAGGGTAPGSTPGSGGAGNPNPYPPPAPASGGSTPGSGGSGGSGGSYSVPPGGVNK